MDNVTGAAPKVSEAEVRRVVFASLLRADYAHSLCCKIHMKNALV